MLSFVFATSIVIAGLARIALVLFGYGYDCCTVKNHTHCCPE